MNEDKMREEFEYWYKSPANTDLMSKLAWLSWKAACESKQKEIDELLKANALAYKGSEQESLDRIADLEANLREQHQNQLDLMEKNAELEKRLRLAALEELEKPPIEPEEVYSPKTEVINE